MRTPAKTATAASVALAALGLVGTGVVTAAPAVHHAAHTFASTPTLKVTVTNTGTAKAPKLKYKISTTKLTAGLVKVSVHGVKTPADLSLVSFAKNYSFKGYVGDYGKFEGSANDKGQYSKAGLKAYNRLLDRTTFYGGPVAESPGATQTDTLNLKNATKVYVLDDSSDSGGPPPVIGIVKVTGKAAHRKAVKVGGAITAHTDSHDMSSFGGDKKLPHKGIVSFSVLKSSTTPHFLDMVHVKEGTTKKQVLDFLESSAAESGQPPSFELAGEADTDVVSPGYSQDIHLNLPKGEYVQLCFVQDRKTGTPHAFMGMIGIVHLV